MKRSNAQNNFYLEFLYQSFNSPQIVKIPNSKKELNTWLLTLRLRQIPKHLMSLTYMVQVHQHIELQGSIIVSAGQKETLIKSQLTSLSISANNVFPLQKKHTPTILFMFAKKNITLHSFTNDHGNIHTFYLGTNPNESDAYLVVWLNQPIWKICSSNWITSPTIGVKIKTIETTNQLSMAISQKLLLFCRWDSVAPKSPKNDGLSRRSSHWSRCCLQHGFPWWYVPNFKLRAMTPWLWFNCGGVPSRGLTYPTLGKGKSSSKCHFWGIC